MGSWVLCREHDLAATCRIFLLAELKSGQLCKLCARALSGFVVPTAWVCGASYP